MINNLFERGQIGRLAWPTASQIQKTGSFVDTENGICMKLLNQLKTGWGSDNRPTVLAPLFFCQLIGDITRKKL